MVALFSTKIFGCSRVGTLPWAAIAYHSQTYGAMDSRSYLLEFDAHLSIPETLCERCRL